MQLRAQSHTPDVEPLYRPLEIHDLQNGRAQFILILQTPLSGQRSALRKFGRL